jgi:hypothetical protein
MNKKNWYKDRILWKLNQFGLVSIRKVECENSSSSKYYEKYIDSDDEILLLFSDRTDKQWTILTTKKIISYHDDDIYEINLDDIQKLLDIEKVGISTNELKYHCNILLVGNEKLPIWTPDSKSLFALMNILRMFPLKKNN